MAVREMALTGGAHDLEHPASAPDLGAQPATHDSYAYDAYGDITDTLVVYTLPILYTR